MSEDETEKIKIELKKIRRDFDNFRSSVEKLNLIGKEDPTSSTLTRGTLTSAGANAEIILKYIIKKEALQIIKNQGRGIKDENPNKPPTLNDFIYTLKNLLPLEVKNHLNNIQSWRNHSSHGNEVSNDESTVETVKASMTYLVAWFFEGYLKGEYAELNIKKDATQVHENKLEQSLNTKVEAKEEQSQIIPPHTKVLQKRSDSRKFKIFITVLSVIIVGAACLLIKKYNIPEEDKVYNFMNNYYKNQNDIGFDANDYYTHKISQFITHKNITPDSVNTLIKNEKDYVKGQIRIHKESIKFLKKEGEISYWTMNEDYSCFRSSKNKFETCNVLKEIGFNEDFKMASFVERKVSNVRHSSLPN